MLKNDNAHALRLKEAIQLTAGEEEANRFAEKYPLSKSADISKKHQWACDICTALQEHFPGQILLQQTILLFTHFSAM